MHTSLRVTGVLPDRLLNQRFDVAGVEVDQPGGQPVTVVFAEGGCELAGEVVDVLASVVEVHDRGGFGQDRGGRFQIQGAPSHARRCGSGSRRGATGPGPARYRGSCRGNRRTTRNALARNRCAGPGARCRRPAAAPAARSPAGSSQCGSPTPLRPGRHRGSQRTDRERNQPLYLGGELRRDLVAEPPFLCPVVPAGGAVAAGFGGRASQIASLTATICSLTCAKR